MKKMINKYIEYLCYQKNYSNYTTENYKEDLLFFYDYLEKECLNYLDIKYQDLHLFFNYLDSFKYSKNTISRRISSIRSFYKFLVRNKYIDYNPFELVSLPKKDKKLPKFLYYNELEILFEIPDLKTPLGVRNRLILELLYATGMRKKHLAYIEKKAGVVGIDTELMLKRYQELAEMEIDWRPSESTISIAKIARANGLKTNKLRRYVERFNGDIEKALKICKGGAKYKKVVHKKAKGVSPNLTTIAQEFEIDMNTLTSLLNKPALHIRQPKQVLMYDKDTNLRQYCLDHGLNYTVIQKAIKLRMKGLSDEDLQSLINRCICEYKTHGQQRPSTWIYSKYGNEALVTHLLTYLKLDAEAVLYDMSTNCIDIYQAMENNSFVRSSKQQYDYLEFIYRNAVKFYKATCNAKHDRDTTYELTESHLEDLVREYSLTTEETSIIRESLDRYTNAVEQYHLFNVGFEKDPEKRVEKIIQYSLDEDEVEDAFFMPLKFDRKALIGRDSEVYKRRVILKNITVSWSYMSEEEKQAKISHYQLTDEELSFVTTTRKEIDDTKAKVFTKK